MLLSTNGFLGAANIVPMLKTSVLPIIVGIGFTYVMIGGNFDLSVTSAINVGASLSIGMFNIFYESFGGYEGAAGAVGWSWVLAIIIALMAGVVIGLINGFLVAKGKVHSFIVTIGMMTALAGFVYTFCDGNTLSAVDSTMVDVLETSFIKAPYLEVFSLRFVIMVALVVLFEIILQKTKWGRQFLITGSNKEVAWQAGIATDRKVITSFIISGICCTLSGALFAMSMNAAVPNYGERGINPLMLVLAATIIGGTTMTGGSGSIVKTAVSVITIEALFSGLILMGLGFDAQVLAAGILLALVVLFEAYSLYKQSLKKGERPAMLSEADELRKKHKSQTKQFSN